MRSLQASLFIAFLLLSNAALAQERSPLLSASLDKESYSPLETVSLTVSLETAQLANLGTGDFNFYRLDVSLKDKKGNVCGFLYYEGPAWTPLVVKNFTFATAPAGCAVAAVGVTLKDREGAVLDSKDLPVKVSKTASRGLTPLHTGILLGVLLGAALVGYFIQRRRSTKV